MSKVVGRQELEYFLYNSALAGGRRPDVTFIVHEPGDGGQERSYKVSCSCKVHMMNVLFHESQTRSLTCILDKFISIKRIIGL